MDIAGGYTQPPPGIPRDALARVRGIDAVRTAADLIAGRRVRPAVELEGRSNVRGTKPTLPVRISFLFACLPPHPFPLPSHLPCDCVRFGGQPPQPPAIGAHLAV